MTPTPLLAELRRQGLRLWRSGEALRYRTGTGGLAPETLELVRAYKPALLAELDTEARELRSLVERTGRQWQAFDTQAHTWDPESYQRSMRTLERNLSRVHELLIARGETEETYGWTLDAARQWHRANGEPGPEPVPDAGHRLLQHTFDAAREVLRELPHAPGSEPWPLLQPLEAALNDAYAERNLPHLQDLCEEYLTLTHRLTNQP